MKSAHLINNPDKLKKRAGMAVLFLILMTITLAYPIAVQANAAEPPGFTIIVRNPPEDLTLLLQLPGERQMEAIELEKEPRAWETYYRFYYHTSPLGHDSLDGAVLIVQGGSAGFRHPLPAETFRIYNNLLTLDVAAQSLMVGQPWHRVPVLVSLRVLFTLLIEGLIFLAFGYRSKRSWLAFIAINLVTQIGLNILFTGPMIGPYWMIGFVLVEIAVFIVEIIAFAVFVREFRKRRAVLYAVVANLASLVLGGWMIANLPV